MLKKTKAGRKAEEPDYYDHCFVIVRVCKIRYKISFNYYKRQYLCQLVVVLECRVSKGIAN